MRDFEFAFGGLLASFLLMNILHLQFLFFGQAQTLRLMLAVYTGCAITIILSQAWDRFQLSRRQDRETKRYRNITS